MKTNTKRIAFILTIIILLVIFAVLGGLIWHYHMEAEDYKNRLENSYMRSIEELDDHMNNITTSLNKSRFAGSTSQVTYLAGVLWKETSAAKSNLSTLPLKNANLNNTNKFFSQCGDYAMVLAKQLASEQPLTDEENDNLDILYDYSVALQEQFKNIRKMLEENKISINQISTYMSDENIETGGELESISTGFKDVEDSFTGFPVLIYDGPFSDDLAEKDPIMITGAAPVEKEDARVKAAESIMRDISTVEDDSDEEGRMPSYGFKSGDISVSVTKSGGFVSYFINGRNIGEPTLTAEQAMDKAAEYIDLLKITDLTQTYFEVGNGTCIINYAYFQDDITCYTDLVKIEVALDNGEIIGFDARNFLTNHQTREFPQPAISLEEAQSKLNKHLTVQSSKLALIPTSGLREALTYEFSCVSKDEQKVLVYINVQSGKEEKLLILIENEEGVLTM